MYVLETYIHRVVEYSTGRIVAGGNGPGTNSTQLFNPYGLVYDSTSRSFIIANYDTNTLVRWPLGADHWTLIAGSPTGLRGNSSAWLNRPVGITMDPMGNIYVADSQNHRIQQFLVGESNGTTIAGITGSPGTASNQLSAPYWVTFDNQLNMYVADNLNQRVQKYLRY